VKQLTFLFILLALQAGAARALESTPQSVTVLWTGTYTFSYAVNRGTPPTSPPSITRNVLGIEKLNSSADVSAQLGTRFGAVLRYEGSESDGVVDQRIVWRFPGAGVFNLRTGERDALRVSERQCSVGKICTIGWTIDHASELIEGLWIVDVWVADKVVFHQVFNLIDATPPPGVAVPPKRMTQLPESDGNYLVIPGDVMKVALVCPQRVLPMMPRAALENGISGKVAVRMRIDADGVKEVFILSPPSIFDESVIRAASQYKCHSTEGEVFAFQDFDFKFTD
jgi:hypothetical protein